MTALMPSRPWTWTSTDTRAVALAKALAADAVEKAGSGHPGTAISLAGVAYVLYQRELRVDPAAPTWLGRDRFVLSAGHASLLQYVQLALAGFGLEISDLEKLRTWGSLTPGHPEYGHTDGVETTTGPLGAGFSNAVGMAMAARYERGLFDPDAEWGTSPFDHYVYTVVGDGCLQEGVASEAASLAGTQKLGNLIALYDDNNISIEGNTDLAFTEDPSARFEAYGWHVLDVDWTNGGQRYEEDYEALHKAFEAARAEVDRPTLIRLHTVIAWPSPTKQGTAGSHGSKLGSDELAGLKSALGLDPEAMFQMDDDILEYTRATAAQQGKELHDAWREALDAWRTRASSERVELLDRLQAGELPANLDAALPTFEAGKAIATRAASGKVLSAIGEVMPELWGGSADLGGSNNTTMDSSSSFLPAALADEVGDGGPYGRTIHFGVREHAMGGILNGITLDGLTRAYGGTFLVFADYMRPAVRLAALMKVPTIFVWSHDSIGVGEDGPTHQPVEHLASLRAIPGLSVVRPADANETAVAWSEILRRTDGPSGIILSRQNLPVVQRTEGAATSEAFASAEGVRRGAYVLAESSGVLEGKTEKPEVILLATGSEVSVALDARAELEEAGVGTRVVSVPCMEWFAEQDADYREQVLPSTVRARVSVEAGIAMGWSDLLGSAGKAVSLEHFGASAAGTLLFEKYGFTGSNVASVARELLEATK
ncbi:transketolase [Actinomyces vulturis]|uniref:transketolase n=1 Tax=Actinomyces vulturis TaxID=1857645 RepID=UPI000B18A0B6|nr:transketolase [Actinomyces vulturis]